MTKTVVLSERKQYKRPAHWNYFSNQTSPKNAAVEKVHTLHKRKKNINWDNIRTTLLAGLVVGFAILFSYDKKSSSPIPSGRANTNPQQQKYDITPAKTSNEHEKIWREAEQTGKKMGQTTTSGTSKAYNR